MNKRHFLLKWLFFPAGIMCGMIANLGYAAPQDDSGQQALQQLKLLQQRLSQTNNNGVGNNFQPNGPNQINANMAASANTNTNTPKSALMSTAAAPTQQGTQSDGPNNNSAEVAPMSDQELIDNSAFKGLTRQLFPLSPERVIELKQMYDTSQFAAESPAGTPPKPTATSQFVNLSPGSTPPVIRLAQGFVSSLVFLDSTGAPWPISAYDLGDPSSFNIQWDKTGNTLMIKL